MTEAQLVIIVVTGVFIVSVNVCALVAWVCDYFQKKAQDKSEKKYTEYLNDFFWEDKEHLQSINRLEDFIEGLEGVNSVNLSVKNYLELLRDREELNKIKLTIAGGNDAN